MELYLEVSIHEVDQAYGKWGGVGAERHVGVFPGCLGSHPPSTEGMQIARKGWPV